MNVILDKTASYAEAKKIEPNVLVNSRLAADMFPLSRQVQIATDAIKACAARLAGVEVPSYEDNEATIPELKEKIAKTIAFLKTFNAEQIDNTETKDITWTARGKEINFKGMPYLLNYVLPNFYFHITTAYLILRHNGVEIGKQDYLGLS